MVVFCLVTVICVYIGRVFGLLVAQFVVGFAVVWLDSRWIQSEMDAPGRDGIPDADIGFLVGVFLRVLMINVALLPLGF